MEMYKIYDQFKTKSKEGISLLENIDKFIIT